MASTYGHPDEQEFGLGYDGTKLYLRSSGGSWDSMTEQANSSIRNANDWSVGTSFSYGINSTTATNCLMFPEPRNISAWSMITTSVTSTTTASNLEVSTDAAAPNSGVWQLVISGTIPGTNNNANIGVGRIPYAVSWPNVKAVRWTVSGGASSTHYLYGFHLWGTYTKTGLEFIDASTTAAMNGKNFDFGDVMQGSLTDRTFRIRNNSAQTANNVVIGGNGAGTGGIVGGLTFSDGGAYLSALNIGTIAPGAISSVITARSTVAVAATLRIEGTRVTAIAGSWT